jgi:hypothetical protein
MARRRPVGLNDLFAMFPDLPTAPRNRSVFFSIPHTVRAVQLRAEAARHRMEKAIAGRHRIAAAIRDAWGPAVRSRRRP